MAQTAREQHPPAARSDDLIVKRLVDEVLVYDLRRHKAHCLNESAAAIWDLCDGIRGVPAIAKSLSLRMNLPVDEGFVWLGLKALSRARLLTAPSPHRGPSAQISRRRLLRKLGVTAAAISLPVVASIVAPTAVSAASCATLLQPCGGPNPACCAGLGLDCVLGICVEV